MKCAGLAAVPYPSNLAPNNGELDFAIYQNGSSNPKENKKKQTKKLPYGEIWVKNSIIL